MRRLWWAGVQVQDFWLVTVPFWVEELADVVRFGPAQWRDWKRRKAEL